MEIVINHLTRMQPGFMCVAGVDPLTMNHIRPVWPGGRLTSDMLACHGGPFDIAAIVDIGHPRKIGHPPELEDHQPDWIYVRATGRAPAASFFQMLETVAKEDLAALFGTDLTRRGTKAAVPLNAGSASLGCVLCPPMPSLRIAPRPPKPDIVRISLRDPVLGPLDLPVTDVRLYARDHVTPDRVQVVKINTRLRSRQKIILAVGLGRPPPPRPDDPLPPAHWLQVNNLHFANDPLWQLA